MREGKESLGKRKKIEGKKGAEPKSVSPPTHPYHFWFSLAFSLID